MIGPDKSSDPADDQTQITELIIRPDGRVYAFGTSRKILTVLYALEPDNRRLNRLLAKLGQLETTRESEQQQES
jgi:hypothetical protein